MTRGDGGTPYAPLDNRWRPKGLSCPLPLDVSKQPLYAGSSPGGQPLESAYPFRPPSSSCVRATNHPVGRPGRLGHTADDFAVIRLISWRGLAALDSKRPVFRVDGFALAGEARQLDLLEVAPVRPFNADDERLNHAMIADEPRPEGTRRPGSPMRFGLDQVGQTAPSCFPGPET